MELLERESHFEFGKNWLSFLDQVSDERIVSAVRGLERLFPNGELQGARFLDIGSGSGLSMLAALRLGAREVVGIDIDENSVEASRRCLKQFASDRNWRVYQSSVFDLDPDTIGRYDVVHSWGVLHHTGAMWPAVDKASTFVAPSGLFMVALYIKTPFCGLWRREKYLYSHSPAAIQALIRGLYGVTGQTYKGAASLRRTLLLKAPRSPKEDRGPVRGMSRAHDTHDWLGGYPYESASAEEVHDRMARLGFRIVREHLKTPGIGNLMWGSSISEYVARLPAGPETYNSGQARIGAQESG
jgi:2-polyprenyl-6-hydroxyphenyl methylase/3-demethylubiquinone-9 3-methyltransferase